MTFMSINLPDMPLANITVTGYKIGSSPTLYMVGLCILKGFVMSKGKKLENSSNVVVFPSCRNDKAYSAA
jgi:hypothetical protein